MWDWDLDPDLKHELGLGSLFEKGTLIMMMMMISSRFTLCGYGCTAWSTP